MAAEIFAYVFMGLWTLALFALIFQSENLKGGRVWRPKARMRRGLF